MIINWQVTIHSLKKHLQLQLQKQTNMMAQMENTNNIYFKFKNIWFLLLSSFFQIQDQSAPPSWQNGFANHVEPILFPCKWNSCAHDLMRIKKQEQVCEILIPHRKYSSVNIQRSKYIQQDSLLWMFFNSNWTHVVRPSVYTVVWPQVYSEIIFPNKKHMIFLCHKAFTLCVSGKILNPPNGCCLWRFKHDEIYGS